ncbi:MAG: PhzF family phenazine biosynthesis protein [Candidatus Korarchaeota archaeon]|nr:PhzF family phenazine biosynthesis protein [Candidatus Korarchaeota archaeon]NIU83670.1 PhzF family phenazine biosynthesis isomerase [Candidatus Thorarchaeota archaeon]NIW13888.1 PhzF family phenazine biosynthesis isomerase [Candidatus Thorarchaeota archaeon]NIW51994.1 PhzF family phenazine biosynthesis isomerase [Candidatus Korarchaeota archaeon]
MKKHFPIYQVDAFTSTPFTGNPAAVCLLSPSSEYEDRVFQSIAAEMNLSETAFSTPTEKKPLKSAKKFSLRWFTPKTEVSLCGHATLATAAVLFYDIGVVTETIAFDTLSRTVSANRAKSGVLLDFPRDDPLPIDPSESLLEALSVNEYKEALYAERTKKLLVHLLNEKDLINLTPDFESLKSAEVQREVSGVIVTSTSHQYDFVSRYFAPWVGINEDPVTGSAHTVLTPYWSEKLGKQEMYAYQASSRGGELTVRLKDERVDIIGDAVIVMKGELYLE